MSQVDSILSLFNLTDQRLTQVAVLDPQRLAGQTVHVISAILTYSLKRCPHCGSTATIKNGTHLSKIRLGTLNGGRYELHLKRQRYLCQHCGATCGAQTKIVKAHATFSHELIHQVIALAKPMITAKNIALIVGISASSVQRILNENVHLRYRVKHLPPNLCFDEIRTIGHQMSFDCCDAVSHKLITVLPTRLSRDIIDYFEARYSLIERRTVRTVTMDMNAQYAQFVRRLFPHALVIIDRFHIVQLAARALDHERLAVINQALDKHSRTYRLLKTQWRLFHLNEDRLGQAKSVYLRGLNEWIVPQEAVDLGLTDAPQFQATYATYQTLITALNDRSVNKMMTLLSTYTPQGNAMDTVIATLRKNQQGVLNGCHYQYSNGPLEGLNRKIKTLKRNCFGFRNQYNMFIRIRLIHE